MMKYISLAVVCVVVVLLLILNPFVIVPAGTRGVVMNFGAVSNDILGEGFHTRIPISQSVKVVDVKIQKEEVDSSAASKDLQSVNSKVALNFHLNPDKVNVLWKEIGSDYKERVINPAIQESVKSATAKYTAEELITKREAVKEEIKNSLKTRLQSVYIIVDEFSIVNFSFAESFDKAIEAKQTAVQQALQAENDLRRIKVEAEQRVAQAEAEAKAIKIQAEAVTQQGGKDYVALQWIRAWQAGGAKVPTIITGNQGASFLMNIDSLK